MENVINSKLLKYQGTHLRPSVRICPKTFHSQSLNFHYLLLEYAKSHVVVPKFQKRSINCVFLLFQANVLFITFLRFCVPQIQLYYYSRLATLIHQITRHVEPSIYPFHKFRSILDQRANNLVQFNASKTQCCTVLQRCLALAQKIHCYFLKKNLLGSVSMLNIMASRRTCTHSTYSKFELTS